jgi:hypothetical protein
MSPASCQHAPGHVETAKAGKTGHLLEARVGDDSHQPRRPFGAFANSSSEVLSADVETPFRRHAPASSLTPAGEHGSGWLTSWRTPSAAVATVGEDYSTDFLIQLNTWEGGLKSSRDWREKPRTP